MRIRQTSVFMERALERFKEITELLNEAGINIRAHSLVGHSSTPYKILRMIVDDTDQALGVLKNRGLSVKTDEVLAVEVDDRTGGALSYSGRSRKRGPGIEVHLCRGALCQHQGGHDFQV